MWLGLFFVVVHASEGHGVNKHDITLRRAVEPYQYPYRSKERGNVWNNIAINLNSLDHPRFKVSKRSVRDRLTLLITQYKAKVCIEQNAFGISCQESELPRTAIAQNVLRTSC